VTTPPVAFVRRHDRSHEAGTPPRPEPRTRLRVSQSPAKGAETGLGREIQEQTGAPSVLVNRIVREAARKRLQFDEGRLPLDEPTNHLDLAGIEWLEEGCHIPGFGTENIHHIDEHRRLFEDLAYRHGKRFIVHHRFHGFAYSRFRLIASGSNSASPGTQF